LILGTEVKIRRQKKETPETPGVDKSLVAMFLKMSPEERLRANDDTMRTILELRDAFQSKAADK
jgi:hypothetical protein